MRNRWTTTSGTARRALCLASGGVLLSLALPSSLALADHRGSTCETQANDTYEELLECVTREGVRNHQEELQEIADENDDPFYPGTAPPAPTATPGTALAAPGSTAFVEVLPVEVRTDHNVLAELPGANPDNVVMAGAHLDSVVEGPGINDNGSGTGALLETALMMADSEPQNTLRFGFWAVEELGLLGSTDYVAGLPQDERDRIALYMNYDMVGSPNSIFMVYDADQSTLEAPVEIPGGSAAIEDLYESYYTLVGEPYDDSEFSGRSDYQAFIEAGIPSGGLFTGAEEVKTEAQEEIWGGTAGEAFDPCYHQACDSYENVDRSALDVNSDLIAYAMLTFASSTESVNGVPGKPLPGPALPAPAGPEGTFAEAVAGARSAG